MNLSQLLLFQCLITQVVLHSVASSKHTSSTQGSLGRSKENNGTECQSVWYKYNQATQNCQCIPLTSLVCDGGYAHTDIQHILTYNDDKKHNH